MMICNYCEEEMSFSNSVFYVQLKGRICKECAKEFEEKDTEKDQKNSI